MKMIIIASDKSRGSLGAAGNRLLAVTAAITCLLGAARAADMITSKVDVTPPTKQFSGDEWRAISLSAGRVLKHVDQALDALADKQTNTATANIEKGLTLVKIVQGTLPPTIVKTEIKGAGLTYQDEDPIKPAFVPIYREYDQVDVVSSVTAQKQQAAAPPAKPADAKGAAAAPKSALAPQYTYAGFDYTGIKLNLRLAKRDLLLAQDLIKQGDGKAATLALQDIQSSGVIFEFSTTREPLVRAMDNLRLAESELKNKHPDQAKTALAGAVDALKNYEKMASDSRSKEVAKMHNEVDEVAKNIAGQKEETFSKMISGWWDKCLGWFGN
ncbi:MAG: YfdX family protein [Verrucomicrobiota bacterium]